METEAYINLTIKAEDCDLPDEVWAALDSEMELEDDLCLLLPWPIEVVPQSGGRTLTLPGLVAPSDVTLGEPSYEYSKSRGVIIEVPVVAYAKPVVKIDLVRLRKFAHEGFLLNSKTTLASALEPFN